MARPDGAHVAASRRADDARLARLVRDLEQRGQLAAADARPEPPPSQPRARIVREAAARRHARPGDAALAERHRQPQRRAERELRPRDDGALHARRRHRCLHRGRRSPAGAIAHRLAGPVEQERRSRRLPLRSGRARRRGQDRVPKEGQLQLAGRLHAVPREPAPRVVLRHQALVVFRPDPAEQGDTRRARGDLHAEHTR